LPARRRTTEKCQQETHARSKQHLFDHRVDGRKQRRRNGDAERKSPAEIIYNLARLRGYAAAARPSGAADRLDTIQRGQAANKSLSYTGGSSGEAEITAEALLKMPMDEFEKFAEKNPARVKRLMGG
jgi:hypothetical protein